MVEGPNGPLVIRSNLWSNIGSSALNLQPGQTGVDSISNTYVNTGIVQYNSNTSGRIAGNIFSNVGQYYVNGCTCSRDYNLATTWTPAETHGKRASAMFTSLTDFHLLLGSPAVNSGDPAATGRVDVEGGTQVGTVDIGAYELR
jgi:hypothetical protein